MTESKQPDLKIYGINGPVVSLRGKNGLKMHELVYVGRAGLVGEVISVSEERTVIQVYESTAGMHPGEPVASSGAPMSITLGPGLLGSIYDGIARPLNRLFQESGAFLAGGVHCDSVEGDRPWPVAIAASVGDLLSDGAVFASVQETPAVLHRLLVPVGCGGRVVERVPDGTYPASQIILKTEDAQGKIHFLTMRQTWPIRTPRPFADRRPASEPLLTGQRVIDTLFPLAKGGAAAIPGGFGTGKTMLQHQLAKYSAADIIVYVGCGERGNEMTQVLEEFSALTDPRTGKSMLDRTVLIANTSNMPVAAREASLYTGITIAEYYRDMGYHVAMMADSTSRWAEALREISGRLEEMPAEEGYPSYLPSRLAAFYERAGRVKTLSGADGSVSLIGAVSPQGNDFSEPVTQNTKRFTRCFWMLDKSLAYSRHYPAIDWNGSYSEYDEELGDWYREHVAPDFQALRLRLIGLLNAESELLEIVKLVGADFLAEGQKLTLETAHTIRVGFLQQDARHEVDCSVPMKKQYAMMKLILHLHDQAERLTRKNIPVSVLRERGCFEKVNRLKFDTPNEDLSKIDEVSASLDAEVEEILRQYGEAEA